MTPSLCRVQSRACGLTKCKLFILHNRRCESACYHFAREKIKRKESRYTGYMGIYLPTTTLYRTAKLDIHFLFSKENHYFFPPLFSFIFEHFFYSIERSRERTCERKKERKKWADKKTSSLQSLLLHLTWVSLRPSVWDDILFIIQSDADAVESELGEGGGAGGAARVCCDLCHALGKQEVTISRWHICLYNDHLKYKCKQILVLAIPAWNG